MYKKLIRDIKNIRYSLLKSYDFKAYWKYANFIKQPLQNEIKYDDISGIGDIEIGVFEKHCADVVHGFSADMPYYNANISVILYDTFLILGRTLEELLDIESRVDKYEVVLAKSNYKKTSESVKGLLGLLSETYFTLLNYERKYGIDRNLSILNNEEMNLIKSKYDAIRLTVNEKLTECKDHYIDKWGIDNIHKVVKHQIDAIDFNNSISSVLPSEKRRVIFFLIDGFGFTQYLWNNKYSASKRKYTIDMNILEYLKRKGFLNELMLGASYISDTGAGLSQIYTGTKPENSNIFSSNYFDEVDFRVKNIKKTNIYSDPRYSHNKSYLNDLIAKGVESKAFLCTRVFDNDYSRMCYGTTELNQVIPPDRIFNILYDEMNPLSKKEVLSIYYTGFDNYGHPGGAFSSFMMHEYEKFNFLFANFLFELALNKPEIFNGDTSIVLSADHGMVDSSKVVFGGKHLNFIRIKYGSHRTRIIDNNRSIFVYNLDEEQIENAMNEIEHFYKVRNIPVDVRLGTVMKLRQNTPDIVIRYITDGIAFSGNMNQNLYHFGGHGGVGAEEVFVPLLQFDLSEELHETMMNDYKQYL